MLRKVQLDYLYGHHAFQIDYQPADVVLLFDQDTDLDGYGNAHEGSHSENPNSYCPIMRADVNNDHTVTIGDLAAVAAQFLQSPPANPRLDQGMTPDNVVTIGDLAAVAAEFLKNISSCP